MKGRNRSRVVHQGLLQNENLDTLLTLGDECHRTLMRNAREWGLAENTPDPDENTSVTEVRHVPPLFRNRSIVPTAACATWFGDTRISLQDLGNKLKTRNSPLGPPKALFCRRATEMGTLFDILRIQRNRLQHDRDDIGPEDIRILASSVLLIVKLANDDLVEPERLEPLATYSLRALRDLQLNGATPDDHDEGTPVGETDSDAARWAENSEALARIERDQQSLRAQVDDLPNAVYALMKELRATHGATSPSVGSITPRPPAPNRCRQALLELRDRINTENDIKAWENICQRPIVDAVLTQRAKGPRIQNLDDLLEVPAFRLKYDRHAEVMDRLLNNYGKEMFRLLAEENT